MLILTLYSSCYKVFRAARVCLFFRIMNFSCYRDGIEDLFKFDWSKKDILEQSWLSNG